MAKPKGTLLFVPNNNLPGNLERGRSALGSVSFLEISPCLKQMVNSNVPLVDNKFPGNVSAECTPK